MFPLPGTFFYNFLFLGNSLGQQTSLKILLALTLGSLSPASKGSTSARS